MLLHETYTKINTLYKRDEKGKIQLGDFSRPEFLMLYNTPWRWSLKIDGTNTSIHWDGEIRIDGKTENAQWDPKTINFLNTLINKEKMESIFPTKNGEYPKVIIYGETYGHGINKSGGQYFNEKNKWGFRIFDVKVGDFWLYPDGVEDVAKKLGVETPTDYGTMTIAEAEKMVIAGFRDNVAEGNLLAEGLVGRPVVQLFNRMGERVMVKIKTRDYK